MSDALKTAPKRRPLNLEEDGTSDEDVMADEGSSSDEENIPPGRKLARNKRQRLMQMFSGLDSDGMRDEGDGSFLEDSAVRTLTEAIYDREWNQGFQRKMPTTVKTASDYALDEKLVRYLHLLFGKGFHVSKAEKLGAAFLSFHPQFGKNGNRRVPRFWRALWGYRRRAPARSRKPRTWPEVAALANWLVLRGHYSKAVWLLVCWGGYLRPSDCMRLRRCDFVPPMSGISDRWCLNLNPAEEGHTSKTGVSDEALIWDDLEVTWMGPVFQALRETGELDSEVWDFTYPDFTRTFRHGVKELKLPHMVPYQVRHSAPSWERLHNRRSRSGVGKKGRWKAQSSLDRYEKSAMVTQVYRRIPADQRAFYESCARELKGVMLRTRLPVPLPWQAVETS